MRIILKPGAVVALLVTLVSLTILATWRYNSNSAKATPTVLPAVTIASSPAQTLLSKELYSIQYIADQSAGKFAPFPITQGVGGNEKGLRAGVKRTMKNPWDMQAGSLTATPVAKGESLTVSIWARSDTKSLTTIGFEQSEPPYENIFTREIPLTPKWTEYRFGFVSTKAFKAGDAAVKVRLAHQPGSIEIAGMHLEKSDVR